LGELIGQSESIRREFKSGRMFDKPKNEWIANISAQVSALANTEGGELFLGIAEDKKPKPPVAAKIEGAPASLATDQLQQLIEGNVSPYLPGIRVHRVRLSSQPDKVVFVVQIPAGSTAYQATDGRYYGRSEFEAKHLPDHEVRLRMSRGKVARGEVHARPIDVELGAATERNVRAETAQADLENRWVVLKSLESQLLPDKVTFDFVLRNDGDLTIRTPAVEFLEIRNERLFDEGLVKVKNFGPMRLKLEDAIVYPGDEQTIYKVSVECKRETVFAGGDYTVRWKMFLDNSPPSFGEIDVASLIETARKQGIGRSLIPQGGTASGPPG
jgi:Putative DNA-binding domain